MYGFRVLLRDRRGQSLAQVMIGFGLAGVLALMLAQLNMITMQGQNAVAQNADLSSVATVLTQALQTAAVCDANMASTNLAQVTFSTASGTLASQNINMNRITVNNGDVLVQAGGRIGKTLTVTALRLEQFKELASGTSYLANIHIEASKQDGNFVGAKVITRDVPIQLRTHITSGVTAQIDGCLTSGGKKGYKNFLESY